jgi:ubiquinone/menaquinone biosynthesis C-methylase UbiE
MIDKENIYTQMQKHEYRNGTSNHQEHNSNDDYWNVLLGDVKNSDDWKNKVALDFGCGQGRNVTNLLSLSEWKRVDGVDISEVNIEHCKEEFTNQNSKWFVNSGVDLEQLSSNEYDFVMSTITLQHIPVYNIRRSLIEEILRVLKPGGTFSFQMAFGPASKGDYRNPALYYDNIYHAQSTNSAWDVRVSNEEDITKDLKEIGFEGVEIKVCDSFSDKQHPQWIYVKCQKAK